MQRADCSVRPQLLIPPCISWKWWVTESGYSDTDTVMTRLPQVIVALHERSKKKRTFIPYRNSAITSILRDSLGGNCRTTMIATVSAEVEQTDVSNSGPVAAAVGAARL